MPEPISNLSSKIFESHAFQERFRVLQNFAAQTRLAFNLQNFDTTHVDKLILQGSVLALSDELKYRRAAQKINSLFYEINPNDVLLNYAVQIISSRLGNFPVISESSRVFGESSLFSSINSDNSILSNTYTFDPEIIGNLYAEEEQARLQIKDKIYHFNIFQKEIFNALSDKAVVSFSAPTSFGKSFIVRHHIARLVANDQIKRALIIVPTKSLIDDFFEDILRIKHELDLDFGIYTHARSVQSVLEKAVFILTQERLSFLISRNPDFVKSFQLVYCDEAHYISRGYRGFVLRDVLQKVVSLCGVSGMNGETKYVFSSPIIKNPEYYKLRIFSSLSNDQSFHKEVRYSPVEKNIHFIAKEGSQFKYYLLRDSVNDATFEDRLEELGAKEFPLSLQTEDSIDKKIQRDVHVVLSSNLQGRSILYTTSPLIAHKYALSLANQLPERNPTISSQEIDDLNKYVRDHYDSSFGLVELLKKGIGLHYGPMPVGLRRAVVDLFERGLIDFIVCTATLLEGVNLPAKNIFIFSDKYGGHSGTEKHSALSFWNLIGRAGRITYGLSGNVFCIEDNAQKYKELIENTESEIKDPETEVVENKTRANYVLQTFLGAQNNKFDYIKSRSRSDIEYLIFELLTKNNPENLLRNLGIDDEQKEAMLRVINQERVSLSIPLELVRKNPGIDPRLQDMLFLKLNEFKLSELRNYFELSSNTLAITGAQLSLVLEITKDNLKWPKDEAVSRVANRLTQWLHEMPITDFIQQVLRHFPSDNNPNTYFERVSKAINVIRNLETELSYSAPKYLKCFFDTILHIAQIKGLEGADVYAEKVEGFLFSLESGISSFIGKFLLEKGVSRPVAIRTNFLVQDLVSIPVASDFFNQQEVVDRLRNGLSSIALAELREHLGE